MLVCGLPHLFQWDGSHCPARCSRSSHQGERSEDVRPALAAKQTVLLAGPTPRSTHAVFDE